MSRSIITKAMKQLSPSKRLAVELFLLRRSYVSKLRFLDAISSRRSTYCVNPDDPNFLRLLKTCRRYRLNPFHVIQVAFEQKQLGDFAPYPSQLYDPDLDVQYKEESTAWNSYLATTLSHRWRAYRTTLDCLADSLGCTVTEAAVHLGGDRSISDIFTWAIHSTFGVKPPFGLRDGSIQEYCLSPVAYAKAAGTVGLQLPLRLVRYGQIAKEIGNAQSS